MAICGRSATPADRSVTAAEGLGPNSLSRRDRYWQPPRTARARSPAGAELLPASETKFAVVLARRCCPPRSPNCALRRPIAVARFIPSDLPRREGTTEIKFRRRYVVEGLETAPAGGAMRHQPIADLMGAVAGGFDPGRQQVQQRRFRTALEGGETAPVEGFIDRAHVRLTDRVAQSPGRKDRNSERLAMRLNRIPQQPSPVAAAAEAQH